MPLGLEGHTGTPYGEWVVIIGGKTAAFDLNESVFTLNITTHECHRLACGGEAPLPRAYHSTCIHGSKLIVFGGITSIGVNDIHYNTYNVFTVGDALDTETSAKLGSDRFCNPSSLRQIVPQGLEPHGTLHLLDMSFSPPRWDTLQSLGSVPCCRSHHAAAVHGDAMYVIGGYNVHCAQTHATPDFGCLYRLNLTGMHWSTISLRTPLYYWGATLTPLGDALFCLFGGVARMENKESRDTFLVDARTGAVERLMQNNHTPLPRVTHSAWRWGCFVYIFGGTGAVGTRFFNDVQRLDLQRRCWETVRTCGAVKPPPRSGATATVVGEDVLLVGGLRSNLTRSLDVFRLNMRSLTWMEVEVTPISMSLLFPHGVLSPRLGARDGVQRGIQTPDVWLMPCARTHDAFNSDMMALWRTSVTQKQPTHQQQQQQGQQTCTTPLQRWAKELRELHSRILDWSLSATRLGYSDDEARRLCPLHDTNQKQGITPRLQLLQQPYH